MNQPLYHRNAAGGPSVKGVECRRCGEHVGLVQGKSGKWYTCQLQASMNPDSSARVAYPWMSHSKYCGQALKRYEAERDAREQELRKAIADAQQYAERLGDENGNWASSIATWQECLIKEGFER